MIGAGKADVFVIILGVVVRRIAVEEGFRSVILLDELFKVFVLNDYLLETSASIVDQRKVVPHRMRLRSEGIESRCVALSDDLIEIRGSPDVRQFGFGMEHFSHIVEVQTGVQRVSQFVAKFVWVISDASEKVGEIGIEVVIDLHLLAG